MEKGGVVGGRGGVKEEVEEVPAYSMNRLPASLSCGTREPELH